jgi:cardiolipin synthase A/B
MNNKERKPHPLKHKEDIFVCGSDYFRSLLDDINAAQKTIDLETYIFNKDSLGQKIILALVDAAKRGVAVRVLVDGCGTPHWGNGMANQLHKAGGKSKVFHPFPWSITNWSHSVVRLPSAIKFIYFFLKANSRNHRKVALIDSHIAYTGSINISKNHLNKEDGGDGWRDTAIKITNANITDLQLAFDSAWNHSTISERLRQVFQHIKTDPLIRLNYGRHRRRVLYKNLLRQLRSSQRRIWITNAYFVPDNFLLRKLKEAALRGVDVRILLPYKSDLFIMPWASSTFYFNLLKAGVRIYEYLPSILHAKTLILDDWMLVGSSNLNHRSLLHDLEADINVCQPSCKNKLANQFNADIEKAHEISLKNWWHKRPWHQRFIGRLFLYMKYWV